MKTKIIIWGDFSNVPHADAGVYIVSSARSLQRVLGLEVNKNTDIEGIILPCARSNPELPQILRLIYDRKFHLYKTYAIPRINVVDFLLMAERRIGVDLQNR